jgi:hypothetical protein
MRQHAWHSWLTTSLERHWGKSPRSTACTSRLWPGVSAMRESSYGNERSRSGPKTCLSSRSCTAVGCRSRRSEDSTGAAEWLWRSGSIATKQACWGLEPPRRPLFHIDCLTVLDTSMVSIKSSRISIQSFDGLRYTRCW